MMVGRVDSEPGSEIVDAVEGLLAELIARARWSLRCLSLL